MVSTFPDSTDTIHVIRCHYYVLLLGVLLCLNTHMYYIRTYANDSPKSSGQGLWSTTYLQIKYLGADHTSQIISLHFSFLSFGRKQTFS